VREKKDIAGLVLAGGAARRMGGANKALVELAGRPLIVHAVERLAPQVAALAISANQDADRLSALGHPILPDRDRRLLGPLAGILSGLTWAGKEGFSHVVSVAGDTPFAPRDLVQRLSAGLSASNAAIAVAASGGRPHPVFAIWPVSLREALSRHLETADERSVIGFARGQSLAEVAFPFSHGRDSFFNINTRAELEAAQRMLQEGPP
jgi:molybdenum cofactor guanylyltransferase